MKCNLLHLIRSVRLFTGLALIFLSVLLSVTYIAPAGCSENRDVNAHHRQVSLTTDSDSYLIAATTSLFTDMLLSDLRKIPGVKGMLIVINIVKTYGLILIGNGIYISRID